MRMRFLISPIPRSSPNWIHNSLSFEPNVEYYETEHAKFLGRRKLLIICDKFHKSVALFDSFWHIHFCYTLDKDDQYLVASFNGCHSLHSN